MPTRKILWLVSFCLLTSVEWAVADADTSANESLLEGGAVVEVAASQPASPAVVESANAEPNGSAKKTTKPTKSARPAKKAVSTVTSSRAKSEDRKTSDWRVIYDEAKNLLIPDHKYLIQYEDEESYGRAVHGGANTLTVTFSTDDVTRFRNAFQAIAEYRNQMRNHCPSSSAQSFMQALDKYASSVGAFNRRALPLVADITENNSLLRLIVDRTTLKDAPVLISRYLQFKKQRFKDNMDRFVPADKVLVESMVTVASLLKSPINDEDWNRAYGLRDTSVELVSMWPREAIFEATSKLGESREAACIVRAPSPTTEPSGDPYRNTTGRVAE